MTRKKPSRHELKRRARDQKARRDAARAKGDCGTCCKQPAQPGRFRCTDCDAKRKAAA